jgi:hypothetical protein
VVHLETGLRGESDAGPNAGREEDGSRIEGVPSSRFTVRPPSVRSTRSILIPRRRSTPKSRCQLSVHSPTSSPSRFRCGDCSWLARVTAAPRSARDAAGSHPMKPLPTTTAMSPSPTRSCRRVEFSTVLIVRISGSSPPGTGGRTGSEPMASTQTSYDSSSPSSVMTIRRSLYIAPTLVTSPRSPRSPRTSRRSGWVVGPRGTPRLRGILLLAEYACKKRMTWWSPS